MSAEAIRGSQAFSDKAHVLSALTRRASAADEILDLTEERIQTLLQATRIPDEEEQRHLILLYVKQHTRQAGEYVSINAYRDYPIAFAKNREELSYHIQVLRDELKYLQNPGDGKFRLTTAGSDYLKRGKIRITETNQAFVAMWFDDSLDSIWNEGFAPALSESGYTPFRMKELEHNGKIDERLIAEINKSVLLVADFTGHRGSVYYEAGYAHAKGIEVIFTVRDDELANAQFDVRQYNHIAWKDAADLRERLLRRIDKTVKVGL